MIVRKTVRVTIAGAALLAVMAVMAVAVPANAQSIFFDWGSNETVNDSGREIIGFDAKARQGELIVSFGDRRVYLNIGPSKALSYPIAVPREKSKWEGVTSVSQKRVSPSWTPTPEMIRENPRLPPWVPGGHPMNPLGTHALYLGSSSYRIHGTDAPWTIGTAASKGCVRMYNKDVQDLYPRVPVGTKVTVTYKTYKTSPLDSESTKGLVAELDKGRKSKSSDDAASSAAQAAKKWRDDDDTAENQKAANSGSDRDTDKATASSDDEKTASSNDEKDDDTGTTQSKTISANKSLSAYSYSKKQTSEKSSDATAQEPLNADDGDAPKKRSSEKRNVETGSVDKSADRAKTSEDSAANDDAKEKSQSKDRPSRKEKSEKAVTKAENSEDAAAIATRALAAAERAAAAAERAAEAAERASAAALKAAAKSEQSSSVSDQKDKEPDKAAEAAPLSAWPVVRSGNP